MNSQQVISREIAIYQALVCHDDIEGVNFAVARRKLMGRIHRPADIHLVDQMARQLYNDGTLVMKSQKLQLNIEKVTDRIDELLQSIEAADPSFRNLDERLKAQMHELADQLKVARPARRMTRA